MAEKRESNEGKLTTLECMECGYREVFTERQFKYTDGLRCYICDGPVRPVITKPGEPIRNRRMKTKVKKRITAGELTIDVDVSDALKGLKAVQREAKKATAALKEFEKQKKILGAKPSVVIYDEFHFACPKCGKNLEESIVRADGEEVKRCLVCSNWECGWSND